MDKVLGNLRIFHKLVLIILVSLIGMALVGGLGMKTLYDNLFEDRKLKTRHVVETAYNTVANFGGQEKTGELSQEKSQQMAIDAVKKLRYEEAGYFWINDMHPRMIMHPYKPQLDGKDLSDVKDPAGKKLFVEFVDKVQKEGAGFVEYQWPKGEGDIPVSKISYVKGYPEWGWIIGSGIYVDDVDNIFMEQLSKLLLLAGSIVTLQIGLSLLVAKAIVTPINRLKTVMGEVEESGDLNKRVDICYLNEVGEMGCSFNSLLNSIQGDFKDVKLATKQASDSAKQLSIITEQTKAGVSKTQIQSDQVATAMNEMSATVQEVAGSAALAADAAKNADKETAAGKQVVSSTVETINQLALGVEQGVVAIQQLAADAENISSVLEVIRGVADQTNLLALNAAIEAARAGEQGSGFAVVADEVRTLAQRTQESTEQINDMIKTLQDGVRNAVRVMDSGHTQANLSVEQAAKAGDSLESIAASVSRISDMNIQIASAAEEQSVVAEEINRNLIAITEVANQTLDGANQTAEASDLLKNLAANLDQRVSRYRV